MTSEQPRTGRRTLIGTVVSDKMEKTFERFFDSVDEPYKGTDFSGRSDSGPFIANGIPSGGLFTGAEGIKTADWIIDLGPEGGDGGGMIVAAGPPEEVGKVEGSYTGRYLKPIIERDKNRMKKRLQEKEAVRP